MSSRTFAFALVVSGLIALPAPAQSPLSMLPRVPAGIDYHLDKPYRSVGGSKRELDIALPKQSQGLLPAVVLLHGAGTWTKGRKGLHALMFDLARQGYVGVAVSYNHSPAGEFLEPLHDVKAAVRWLRSEAKTYRIDPDRIGVIGFSAGSCLACLLGLTTPNDGLEGDNRTNAPSSKVQAVVGYFGPSDFRGLHSTWTTEILGKFDPERLRRPILKQNLENWFGGTPAAVAPRYDRLSPIAYAHKDAAPLLLLHGKADRVVPFEQSWQLERKLVEKKARVRLHLFEKAGHDFDEGTSTNARQAAALALGFLKEQLGNR